MVGTNDSVGKQEIMRKQTRSTKSQRVYAKGPKIGELTG